MSDLQRRSMDHWRDQGYLVASVEHRKRFPAKGKPKCRACGHMPMIDIAVDLWNCFDLFAIRTTPPDIILLQVTSHSNHATRREKILSSGEAYLCKLAGIRILVESWKKVGNRWQLRDEELTFDQFQVELPVNAADLYEMQRRAKLPELPAGATLFQKPEFIREEDSPF